ncbi:RNA polymerase sigma factor [Lignipirellula cremea]|uniref:RNA polymerase sigma factor n=1 Tax=Lignipirellula cremea TaxID=2528010 RepID=A0A518DQ41_9BACT|nr:sigma-70 family RNA polymerase sigma factor [Lignipirellula cremea]QDU93966.1 ECF RNA polymerase sigma factor SigE [Lignipirellula cremea]
MDKAESPLTNEDPVPRPFNPAQLVADHQAGVWRYLRAIGCDPALADDLTQETFLAVFEKPLNDYHFAATSAYLRRVAKNLLITHKRRAGRMHLTPHADELDVVWTDWIQHDNGEEALSALKDCFRQLTERARLALEMRFRQKSSRPEIAAALEITEHGAKNLMQRAKKQLRTCVESKIKTD